ncbi:bifunctional nicotinamidase/pyrazinamidase [Belliella kenyensis]|uniref:nicotinamidase n=1 Tax=Belliella kenyensis TaxID=1472724 RepID=A0ABV8EQ39_9BACT|nr:bifunctional nicotinamidase/pyrazinamidase [Belliella kenyensis]MCH7401944.1 bifunctional nicotinamidase/pyrazinamidase [Belliella kenyensis]MDN3605108.1 bifunctional nicotinamidase/pyrazinamidase [Belliella kenyensis]
MRGLIIVDVQNDFLPGGALAVDEGDQIIPIINQLQSRFDFIIATQDWHPENHGSFAANHPNKNPGEFVILEGVQQILWPVHCVQGTFGSEFHQDLNQEKWQAVFKKGMNPLVDSYSGFFDNNKKGDTGLSKFLKDHGVEEIFVCGLAEDYCVKFTVLDGLNEGFKVHLILDATKAVNLHPDDFAKAMIEMENAGAIITHSDSF